MKIKVILIILLIIVLGIFYYNLTNFTIYQRQTALVNRVIDGDTLELENNQRVRLKGINTPEKSQPYYEQAKSFLGLIENKTIGLEIYGTDMYGRKLTYVFYNNQLINEQILKSGFAHLYYYDKDKYYKRLKNAEAQARKDELRIWEKSPQYSCLKLIELKYKETERCTNQEQLIIQNLCQDMQVIIKDDATHIYSENIKTGVFTKNFSCIWNNDGDSLYIYDDSGLLLFYRY